MEQIQEIKQKYGQEAEEIISSGLGMVKKGKKYHCPNTFAHKHGDKDPSMSWDSKRFQFYCFACGMKIDIYGYYKDHLNYTHDEVVRELLGVDNYKDTSMQKSRDTFYSESKKVADITEECIKYIKSRGIKEETIKQFNLCSYKNAIAFPYYKFDTVVGYKTRKPLKDPEKPKMLNITGSKPYLFNAQNIDLENKELIICEGEFDCMIIYQCEFTNVVSVGAGANSLAALIEQAKDFLENFESIIVISDNDKAGEEMDRKMVELLGDKVKLIDKRLYTMNDVNEEYYKGGSSKIAELIDSARFKIEGRRDLDKEPYKGLMQCKGNYVPTGIKSIDFALNDLAPKCVTLITGRSNGGKTTFVKQVIANAIDKSNKVYLMNGENDAEMLINEIYQLVIGKDENCYNWIKINKRKRKEPKKEVLRKLQEWHKSKFYLFNKGESKLKTIDELLAMIEIEIKFNQYDLIVIDNLMSILSVKAAEKYEQQADFVQKLCDLSKNYNTHIILVLHPNKTYNKGSDMDFEQISGSSDIYNKADNIIAVIREYESEKIEEGINGYLQVLKNRYYGELPKVETYFDKDTGLLLEIDEQRNILAYNLNWKREIIPKDIQEVITINKKQESIFDNWGV